MSSPGSGEYLEIIDPEGEPKLVQLTGDKVIVGRAEDARVRLDAPAVSRYHAEFYRDPFGRWWVRDLRSRNGTRLNGEPVAEAVLPIGAEVAISRFKIRLRPPANLTTTAGLSTMSARVGDAGIQDVRVLPEAKPTRLDGAHLQILARFSRELGAVPDVSQRLQALCSLAVSPELHGRVAAIVRVKRADPEDASIVFGPVGGAKWDRRMPHVSRAIVRALIAENRPVFGGPAGGGLMLTIVPDAAPNAAIACPLGSDDVNVEFLYTILPPEYGSAEWLSLVSLAVEGYRQAELGWVARRRNEDHVRIEQDLNRARDIQHRLVPSKPDVPGLDVAIGFEPCQWVGGDYVDVLAAPGGRAFLTVADVCGKGLPAALVASALHSRVHGGIEAGLSLSAVMQGVNRYLHEFLPGDSFVTMCALMVDGASGKMQVVNAGHLAPIVREASGRTREIDAGGNPPLGIADDLDCSRDILAPGDMVAIFTDGLAESGDTRSIKEGIVALRAKLSATDPATPVSEIAADILASAASAGPASDDRTLLLARRHK